ncbi:MAG: hypothetical protein ABSE57_23480 [Bryobacteraceae bacterium]
MRQIPVRESSGLSPVIFHALTARPRSLALAFRRYMQFMLFGGSRT